MIINECILKSYLVELSKSLFMIESPKIKTKKNHSEFYLICDLNQLHNALECLVEKEDTFLDSVIYIFKSYSRK